MKYLFLYSTTDGHTKCIVDRIGEVILKAEPAAKITYESLNDKNLKEFSFDLGLYDRVLVGASIRYGHFHPNLLTFATQYRDELHKMNTAFFGINLTARKANKNTVETNPYIKKWLSVCPWQPTISAVFAGALYYPRYTFFDRTMIRFIMYITKGDTDPTTEKVYTDWDAVTAFAQRFQTLTEKDLKEHAEKVQRHKKEEEERQLEKNNLFLMRLVAVGLLGVVAFKLFSNKKSIKS
ncbi:Flavodoxin domain containing protein, putative [Angomonas deanei]|uniref:Flavodoxin domain containing protein, putative n=1 Tax=Angomonas deanei TaxID=59799 RepID=A0A7G2C2D7_9TRYP|nr:Flavodoxin domain containing protein, putative [Angomonas deanei]